MSATVSKGALAAPRGRAVPGDGLLHPVLLGAVAVLALNDHVLKAVWPGLVTGKLSDAAGLLVFPLLLVAAWECAAAVARRPWFVSARGLALAAVATALGFALVKTVPPANDLASVALGQAQWLIASALAAASGAPAARLSPVPIALDPGDLVALGAVAAGYWIGHRRIAQAHAGGSTR